MQARREDMSGHSGRQVGRDAHSNRQMGQLAPSGAMGYPEVNALVTAANPTPVGAAAPTGTSKVYAHDQRGYRGHAAYAVPNESMPGIKEHYRDLRRGTNNSGNNPENQTMGSETARQTAIVGANGHQTMIQDAYGRPQTNNLGVSY